MCYFNKMPEKEKPKLNKGKSVAEPNVLSGICHSDKFITNCLFLLTFFRCKCVAQCNQKKLELASHHA